MVGVLELLVPPNETIIIQTEHFGSGAFVSCN
jgi:hypothetical protein